MRVKVDMTTGSSVIDMGLQGKMSYRLNPATRTFDIDFSMTTTGFADMITQLFEQLQPSPNSWLSTCCMSTASDDFLLHGVPPGYRGPAVRW